MADIVHLIRPGRVAFWCPGCDSAHALNTGDEPPAVWSWNESIDRPTMRPSVLTWGRTGERCHSFVTDGRIEYLGDCEHALAGQTVDLPAWRV